MGRQTEQVAVHKERHIVPVRLNISKLSGVGEDTLFIGIMEVGTCSLLTLPTCKMPAELWAMYDSIAGQRGMTFWLLSMLF
jgi:hypothetical protein